MSFFSFYRTVLGTSWLLDKAGDIADTATAELKKKDIVSDLIRYTEGFKEYSELNENTRIMVSSMHESLSDGVLEKEVIGEFFLKLATVSYLHANDYWEVLQRNILDSMKTDEYGDVDTESARKVVAKFLKGRLEGLIDLSTGILSPPSFDAICHPAYTSNFLPSGRFDLWVDFILYTLTHDGLLTGSEVEIEDDCMDFQGLISIFEKNGWTVSKAHEVGQLRAMFAIQGDCYFVVFCPDDAEIEHEDFVEVLGSGVSLVEEGECNQILFFSGNDDLLENLERQFDDDILCVETSIAKEFISRLI